MKIFFRFCSCLAISSLFYSCKTSFPISEYAKYNDITDSYLYYYSNDSLGLSLEFLGRQRIMKDLVQPKLSLELRKFIKERIKGMDAKIFYVSKPTGRYFGYRLYAFVFNRGDNPNLEELKIHNLSLNNAAYYTSTVNTMVLGQWRIREILLPLKNNRNVLFFWIKEMDPSIERESNVVEENLFFEHVNEDISTLATGDAYKVRRLRKDLLYKTIYDLVQTSEYIAPLSSFNKINGDSVDSYGLTSFFYQMKATAFSFIDNQDSIKSANRQSFSKSTRITKNDGPDSLFFSTDFTDSIEQLAAMAPVLMFNEVHYDWRNRWLLTYMLPALKKQGYKYLCMEALSTDSSNIHGYPSLNDGFYFKEPFMGNLLRTALELGFRVVEYEDTIRDHHTIDERERTQAANLYYQFKKDPGAKWLVLAGYAHINKNGFSKGQPSMMQYFQEISKAGVKCIDQTKYSSFFYGSVNTGYPGKGFFVVRNMKKEDIDADLFILSNLDRFPYESDHAKEAMGFHKYVFDRKAIPGIDSTDYLFVYRENEYQRLQQKAIPVFIKKVGEIKADFLFLPENRYLFFLVDSNDKKERIQVDVVR